MNRLFLSALLISLIAACGGGGGGGGAGDFSVVGYEGSLSLNVDLAGAQRSKPGAAGALEAL